MIRKIAIKALYCNTCDVDNKAIVDKIYDDFETQLKKYNDRNCENCKYLNEYGRCLAGVIPTSEVVNGVDVSISDTFNCNKWENR